MALEALNQFEDTYEGGICLSSNTIGAAIDQWGYQERQEATMDIERSVMERFDLKSQILYDTHQSAQQPPSAPSTPDQPTRKVASFTPERELLGELLDTATLLPRALWAADREQVFLSQADALQMVAIHDAGALVGALLPGLAAARVTAALTNWRAGPAAHRCTEAGRSGLPGTNAVRVFRSAANARSAD
jgi:hypothetical protein